MSKTSCNHDILSFYFETNDFFPRLQSKIIDIKQRMQQVQHFDSGIIDEVKSIEAEAGNFLASSSSKNRDTVGLDDRMEDLLDLLIEGPHQLLAVAILDSIGLDKTAFVAEAYSSNYVKHYFDCHAWVPEPHSYDAHRILDIIIKFLMPSSRLMFPAHLEISTRHVYQLWIAEGFIEDNNEATAKKYLEQLINRGFVEANKRRAGGTINTCSIPGRCRPVLLGVASKVEFIFSPFMDIEESRHIDPIDWEKICGMFKLLRVLDLESLVLI
ncbi:hypothetical protein WN943_001602 [Citrus x changshan-huyou]